MPDLHTCKQLLPLAVATWQAAQHRQQPLLDQTNKICNNIKLPEIKLIFNLAFTNELMV
jgi:hypothetical protein